MKHHLYITARNGNACGRTGVPALGKLEYQVRDVTCLNCQKTPEYIEAKAESDALRQAAFDAQTPRALTEPWHQGNVPMLCKSCGNDTFRIGERSCYGHYENYRCAACGGCESRLTETGMSF